MQCGFTMWSLKNKCIKLDLTHVAMVLIRSDHDPVHSYNLLYSFGFFLEHVWALISSIKKKDLFYILCVCFLCLHVCESVPYM